MFAPAHLLVKLDKYPKIQQFVDMSWGTVRLKEYLEHLMGDTRDGTRQGFPFDVSMAIINLALENQAYLESKGLCFEEDPATQFTVTGWQLPRNF
jgi:hypothetical protein